MDMQNNTESDMKNLHEGSEGEKPDVNEEWQKAQEAGGSSTGAELEELKAKYAELEDQYKRVWADQQNMMNRFNREKQDILKYAATNTLDAILPALDNFDFATKSLNESTPFADVIKSINMLQEQLIMSLKSVGLEEVDTSIVFDPQFHEAVSNIKDPSKEEGTIIEVLKKGYKVKDKVLRVATVVVSTKE